MDRKFKSFEKSINFRTTLDENLSGIFYHLPVPRFSKLNIISILNTIRACDRSARVLNLYRHCDDNHQHSRMSRVPERISLYAIRM